MQRIFVGGAIRTGTTLLQSIICSSPDTHPLIHECQYLAEQMHLFAKWRNNNSPYITHYFGTLENFHVFARNLVEQLLAIAGEHIRPHRAIVLKCPHLSYYFGDLAEMLPDARFIVCVRDPRDTIASMLDVAKRQSNNKEKGTLVDLGHDMEAFCRFFAQFYRPVFIALSADRHGLKGRLLFIKYEDLVGNTATVVQNLAKFCNISLADFRIDQQWRAMPDYAASVSENNVWRTDLYGRGVSNERVGGHKDVLSADDIGVIDRLCADFYKIFGYRPAN